MYFGRTDDPIADFVRYQAEQEEETEKLPKCDNCGEPIMDDYCYDVGGDILCEDCMNDLFRVRVDDYIED